MCGIAGIISDCSSDLDFLGPMTDRLTHRGPDNRGLFREEMIGLGHRRLSIIDLSEEANQPISNEDKSIYLICNGEIYNFKDKTIELKSRGHIFRSNSDCEVLLHLYEEYGDDFLEHVNGMFAFAIWDKRNKRMVLAVDRFGKKPLYYGIHKERLVFASEMKSLLFFKWIKREIDFLAIDRYLSLRHIPAPLTIFKSIKKFEPASMMIWQKGSLSFKRYWNIKRTTAKPYNENAITLFDEVLSEAVKIRLQSDVPLGIYLSGGVDSAAIAGLMQNMVQGKKVSYTISFDYKYDERPRAKKIADYLNYEYNPMTVSSNDFDFIPAITYHLDEPFGDLLCLPAFLLAKKAKEKLTVALTGDGADEILSGYFHQKLMVLWEKFHFLLKAPGVSKVLSSGINWAPTSLLNIFFDYPDRISPTERIKFSQALANCKSFGNFYEGITSCFSAQDKEKLYTPEFRAKLTGKPLSEEFQQDIDICKDFSFLGKLSILDLKYWIPFSVIYRLDKMNMAHAIETRSPFLDYHVVQAALNLPDEAKLNPKRNKEALRRIIERLYPPPLREKGKQAFYMPLTSAYKKRYLTWVSSLLTNDSVKKRGFFQWSYIEGLFDLSRNGSMLATRQLTALSMLESWFKVFLEESYEGRTESDD